MCLSPCGKSSSHTLADLPPGQGQTHCCCAKVGASSCSSQRTRWSYKGTFATLLKEDYFLCKALACDLLLTLSIYWVIFLVMTDLNTGPHCKNHFDFLGQTTEHKLKFKISASWPQPWPLGKMFNLFVTQVALLEMAKTTSNIISIFKVPQNQSLQSYISEQRPRKWLSTVSPGSTLPCPEPRTLGRGGTYWICLGRTKGRSTTTSGV